MITNLRHPLYSSEHLNWFEWRLTYEGGWEFVNQYLEKFGDFEEDADFSRRKRLTPIPAFAKAAVDEIKNAIFQRLVDVTRDGGPSSFQTASTGSNGGVDLHGSTMNFFMGETVLLELLIMGRVGIFVDSPPVGETAADDGSPYAYRYRAEDVLNWKYHPHKRDEFSQVLLRDYETVESDGYGLPSDSKERYRLVTLQDNGVLVQFYNQQITPDSDVKEEHQIGEDFLELDRIPFTVLTLPHSIIKDITRHQIALLNLESADIAYALDSNFTIYTEQRENKDYTHFAKDNDDIKVGNKRARIFQKGMLRPEFIAPPAEPLEASMKKQEQLKRDLRELVHLAVANVGQGRESADSKEMDQRGLEAGLSQIGMVLEQGERKLAEFWADFENADSPANIAYPLRYNLRSDAERREEIDGMVKIRPFVVSKTFQNEISYRIADAAIGHKTPAEMMAKIREEIKEADAYSGDVKTILESVKAGALDLETAAKILGYPKETVAKAAQEHADRAARIAASQSAARGVPDAAVDPQAADNEKEGKQGRGDGRFNQDNQLNNQE